MVAQINKKNLQKNGSESYQNGKMAKGQNICFEQGTFDAKIATGQQVN